MHSSDFDHSLLPEFKYTDWRIGIGIGIGNRPLSVMRKIVPGRQKTEDKGFDSEGLR